MAAILVTLGFGFSALAQSTGSPAANPAAPKAGDVASPKQPAAPPAQAPASPQTAQVEKKKELTLEEEFEQEMKTCMESWDRGTSMSKSQWRQVCQRTVRSRLPFKRGSAGGAPMKEKAKPQR
jgi:hypothetical protein